MHIMADIALLRTVVRIMRIRLFKIGGSFCFFPAGAFPVFRMAFQAEIPVLFDHPQRQFIIPDYKLKPSIAFSGCFMAFLTGYVFLSVFMIQ